MYICYNQPYHNMFNQNMYSSCAFNPNTSSKQNFPSSSTTTDHNNPKLSDDYDIMIRWKSGKQLDPRLLAMLELFGEVYEERQEFLNKVFRGTHQEVFKKVGNLLKRKKTMKKNRSMSRSLSMRALERRGLGDEGDETRLERFRIKTPNVIVDSPRGEGGQAPATTSTQTSSQVWK